MHSGLLILFNFTPQLPCGVPGALQADAKHSPKPRKSDLTKLTSAPSAP